MYPATVVSGDVVHRISGCDYFMVESGNGYDVLEWEGDYDPDKGDTLVGAYESPGLHEVRDDTADQDVNVYTEDYQLSKQDALESLVEHCE